VNRCLALSATMLGAAALLGCDPGGTDASAPRQGHSANDLDVDPDAEIIMHAVERSTPTRAGLAYIRAAADVLTQAEAATGDERIQVLRRGLALPVPANLGEAEILRLEMGTTLAETLLERPSGAPVARDLLMPMLAVERSLPLDRVTARALVTLGDATAKTGQDALAAGSYGRALRVMNRLREELVEEMER